MKIIFFGTPDYVLPVLKKLHKYHEIVAVVTQPPKPVGREKQLTYSAIDTWAHKKHIPIHFEFDKLPKADLGVLAAYGKIVPESVISNLKLGILNIHPSLLPKFRGASPIQANIIEEPENIGVTIIKLDSKMDHGPIITQFKDELMPEDTLETVRKRLFKRSAQVLIDLIPNYLKGEIKLKEQNHKEATYTKILKKEDGFIDLKKNSPQEIERRLRAYTPWPGIWTYVQLTDNSKLITNNKKRLRILKVHIESSVTSHKLLVLDEIQLQGKNPVSWKQFKEAYPSFNF